MNDEEREAVEYWKTHMKILHLNTQLASEHYIKVLLDLVEKQSKEIEEIKRNKNFLEKQEIEYIRDRTEDEINYRWKDKIKAKIEEYEKMKEATKMDTTYYGEKRRSVIEALIAVLQSLLEKE